MTQGPFNGVASALSSVFGGTVTIYPSGKPSREITAIFRLVPHLITDHNGVEVQTHIPTLRANKPDADDLFEGDQVEPGDGKTYKCLSPSDATSPADDALIEIQLTGVS